METQIILVRHGETEWNTKGIFRGRRDIHLNETGRNQARKLAEELTNYNITRVYSSPLSRARETAEIIGARTGTEVTPKEAFNNIELGNWQGKPKEDIKRDYPELWHQWVYEPDALQIPDGETLVNIVNRIKPAIKQIIRDDAGRDVVIVSHRSILKLTMGCLLGLEKNYFWKFHVDNCSYSIFKYSEDRGIMVTLLNQTKHLPGFVTEKY